MIQIKQAIILSAGLGSRMGELTKDIAKPMLVVNAISLIERNLIYLVHNSIEKVVINLYYKADKLQEFVQSLAISKEIEICFSKEHELLGPGGGIKNALHFFNQKPFFVLNSDSFFEDTDKNNSCLTQLESKWNSDLMSTLLLTVKKQDAFGYYAKGDFDINEAGQLNQNNEVRDFIFSGASIMDYRAFEQYPETILQLSPTMYQALMKSDELYGVVYQGKWYHIGDIRSYQEYQGLWK